MPANPRPRKRVPQSMAQGRKVARWAGLGPGRTARRRRTATFAHRCGAGARKAPRAQGHGGRLSPRALPP
eukprot:13279329-Alexandrium_andersonii.AAC.1